MSKLNNVILSLDELYNKCFWWQGALGISEWEVVVKIAKPTELEDAEADCEWSLTRRSATIRFLDPRYREPDEDRPYDMEYLVVHELLHLVFAAWDDWTRDDKHPLHPVLDAACIEQPIDTVAKLLVNLKRLTEEPQYGDNQDNT